MKIRYPSEKIEEYRDSFKAVKELIATKKGVPVDCQVFVCNGRIFEQQPDFVSGSLILDLMVKVLDTYIICSDKLQAMAIELGYTPLVPPESAVLNRRIEDLQFTPRFFSDNDIYCDKEALKKFSSDRARPFLSIFESHKKQRLRKINEVCSRLQTRTYVLSTCNCPYTILLRNFIASCDQSSIDIRKRLIMFPMDVATYEVCLELGVAAYFEEGVYGETTSTHNVYGDMDFRICMFLKNAMVQDMLELDNDLLVQDIDMVWLKDPISKLEHLAYKNC